MAKPYKELRKKMSPAAQERADRRTAEMLNEARRIELHTKATKEAGKQAFLARPQIPANKNPYEHTVLLIGEQRLQLGPVWLKAWKDEEELRRPSASDPAP
jgi:hypothetical protein